MTELADRRCVPCEGGVTPLTRAAAEEVLLRLHEDWQLVVDGTALQREWRFKDFFRTMSFVNLLKDLDLFELKTANFTPPRPDGSLGEPQKIAEYYGVSEEKLLKLEADKFLLLRDNGALAQIYAHLLSLVGWDRLIALAIARQTQPEAANA